jgi:hypothetical protein
VTVRKTILAAIVAVSAAVVLSLVLVSDAGGKKSLERVTIRGQQQVEMADGCAIVHWNYSFVPVHRFAPIRARRLVEAGLQEISPQVYRDSINEDGDWILDVLVDAGQYVGTRVVGWEMGFLDVTRVADC